MTSKMFFDTNVLVYAFGDPRVGPTDPRPNRATDLLEEGGVVSVQVLNEYSDIASRKLGFDWDTISQALSVLETLCPRTVPLTLEMQREAIAIAARLRIRIYDAMIVAAALQSGCTVLYSEDLQHGQKIGNLRIENPFLGRAR